MEIGLGSYAFRWSTRPAAVNAGQALTVSEMIDQTADMGCTLLQIADHPELDEMPSAALADLRQYAHERDVRLQVGTSGVSVERLDRYLEISTALGADVLRLVLHGRDTDSSLDEAGTVLDRVAGSYRDAGVGIAIENHFLTSSADLARLVERVNSPAVGVCLDTANSIMIGEWPATTVSLLAGYALCVHLKDYAVVPDSHGVGGHVVGRPLGEGWLDIEAVLGAVKSRDAALGGRLGIILEHWCPRETDDQATMTEERRWREHAVGRARKLVGSAGVPVSEV